MQYKTFHIDKHTDIHTLINLVSYFSKGQTSSDVIRTEIVTICSEIAYNVVKFASHATLNLTVQDDRLIIKCIELGNGFSIPLENAFEEGLSTAGSLGLGLASIVRMCDDFEITTSCKGTTIMCTKELS